MSEMRGYEKFAEKIQRLTEKRLIAEFLQDLKGCHYHWTLNIKDLIKKWEGRQKT